MRCELCKHFNPMFGSLQSGYCYYNEDAPAYVFIYESCDFWTEQERDNENYKWHPINEQPPYRNEAVGYYVCFKIDEGKYYGWADFYNGEWYSRIDISTPLQNVIAWAEFIPSKE